MNVIMSSSILFRAGAALSTAATGIGLGLNTVYKKFPSTIDSEMEKVNKLMKEKSEHHIGFFGAREEVVRNVDRNRDLYVAPLPRISQSYANQDARNNGDQPYLGVLVADRELADNDYGVNPANVDEFAKIEGLDDTIIYSLISVEGQKAANVRVGHLIPVTLQNNDTIWGHLNRSWSHWTES